MGFGGSPPGTFPFGQQLEPAFVRYAAAPPPPAILLDLALRDAVLDANGRFEAMDVTDQKVAIAFGVPRGSVKHAPHIGHDFRALPRVRGSALVAACESAAASATPFDELIAAGAVRLLDVEVLQPKTGETRIAIRYQRTIDNQVRRANVGTP